MISIYTQRWALQAQEELENLNSIFKTSHSWVSTFKKSIQPIISCNGNLLSCLFIVLKETNDIFESRVQETLFIPINVIVKASKSGKMTSDHFKMWLEEAYFPNSGSNNVLFIDSRNNLIKLQSLIHNQLSSPRYHNLFKYSWFKSGYTNERPEEFKNPVKFSFDKSSTCDIKGCNNIAVVKCS
ncbi:hypothetical protein ALC56_14066 [Trachymyrmex septentrionalis]|uniref:Transposase Tc5 C-terminal domain-containing protein n=1 Tax=Trachymyrmex septentrionalis TaxID=34720 RepID=A0A195ETK2_9HYME|nr:hypothetical protein ALC56_14066 [Trachymyrmex septentrionalis]